MSSWIIQFEEQWKHALVTGASRGIGKAVASALAAGLRPAASLVLLAMNYLLTFVHELAHASALVHYGRRVKSAGFMIYFGSPAFFIESSDGLMLERGQRTPPLDTLESSAARAARIIEKTLLARAKEGGRPA